MALPNIMRRLFRNDGYGPLLKPEIIPFASDLSSKDGSVAASTEWVKNLAVAHVYVDAANGSDSNGGFSASDATATIGKALEIAFGKDSQHAVLHIAGGSYTENIELMQQQLDIVLLGNVSITGYIALESSSLFIDETENTLSISHSSASNPAISIMDASEVHCGCSISISELKYHAINCYGSNAWFTRDVSITVSNSAVYVINVHDNGFVHVSGNVTVGGSSLGGGVFYLFNGASIWIGGSCTCAQGLMNNNTSFIAATVSSMITISGVATAYSSTTSRCAYFVNVSRSSVVSFPGGANLYHKPTSGNGTLYCSSNSVIYVNNSLNIQVSNISSIIDSRRSSYIMLEGGPITLSGSITYCTANVSTNGVLQIPSDATVSGTVTGARRYSVSTGGMIAVDGAGANRIPGASAGYVNSANYGYYG